MADCPERGWPVRTPKGHRSEIQAPEPARERPLQRMGRIRPREARSREGRAKHGGTTKHMLSSVALGGRELFCWAKGVQGSPCRGLGGVPQLSLPLYLQPFHKDFIQGG